MGIRILAAFLLALAIVLMFSTPGLPIEDALGDPGPAFLPRIVGACMAVLTLPLLLQVADPPEDSGQAMESRRVITLALLAVPLYYLAFQWLGYTLATAFYLFAAFSLLGPAGILLKVRFGLAAVAFSLVSGLVLARLLNLPLPGVLP